MVKRVLVSENLMLARLDLFVIELAPEIVIELELLDKLMMDVLMIDGAELD
jgi:hypothetical protein